MNKNEKRGPIKVAIIGAGARGRFSYAAYAKKNPKKMVVVAVAEIREEILQSFAKEYNIPKERCFNSAEEFFKQPKICDAVFICTLDKDHHDHTIKAFEHGYNIILEKPMASTMDDCIDIVNKAKEINSVNTVCHVLRYTPFYQKIKEILSEKKVGEPVTLSQFENVGYWHMAHSFVRGNWNNSEESCPMILAKCCHDLDIIHWILGKQCISLSSYGSNRYFNFQCAPEGVSDYCLDGKCKVKDECPYDAEKIYINNEVTGIANGNIYWPNNVVTQELTEVGMYKALRTGKYGKCVFRCNNNVVDNQVVNMRFEDGIVATLTMCAFTKDIGREIKILCTKAEITGDMEKNAITIKYFNGENQFIDITKFTKDLTGHGGGEDKMLNQFFDNINNKYASSTLTNMQTSLHSHIMAFAAEESRINGGQLIDISKFEKTFG